MRHALAILMFISTSLARAGDQAGELAAKGVAEFTAAYASWDGGRFDASADLFRRASALAPASGAFLYWIGVAEFHRMLHLQSLPANTSNKVAAETAAEAALTALSSAVKLDDRQAESHALLGTLYGMKIQGNLFRALRFGPRVQKYSAQAMEFGRENPRVWYLLGAAQFHMAKKPGALREALASLIAAENLFEVEDQRAAGPLEPRWGRGSCLVFLGQSYERLGQPGAAADYFTRALALQPGNRLAAEGLARVRGRK